MDGAEPFGGEGSVVQVYDCHAVDPAEPNQSWNWAGNGTSIASRVSGSRCLHRALDGSSGVKLSSNCSESWELNSIGQLLHAPSGLCLGALASNEPIPLPQLRIQRGGVLTTGVSNGGDMAVQFHVAFSSAIDGSCVFSGQPYRCAATRFPDDYMVPQSDESSVPFCDGCPTNYTLIYDHCKNHPQWFDTKTLKGVASASAQAGAIDSLENLRNDRVFAFRGSLDKCYLHGSMQNVVGMYEALAPNGAIDTYLNNTLPFPHCLPLNTTSYVGHTEPAGYDGPGHCLDYVFFHASDRRPAVSFNWTHVYPFLQSEFYNDSAAGFSDQGFLYVPDACGPSGTATCRLIVYFSACGCGGVANDIVEGFGPWAEANDIVILSPCTSKGPNPTAHAHPNSAEIGRGCLDVYGQLGSDYATRSGEHMAAFRAMLGRLTGF